jgi:hypothetical protein
MKQWPAIRLDVRVGGGGEHRERCSVDRTVGEQDGLGLTIGELRSTSPDTAVAVVKRCGRPRTE